MTPSLLYYCEVYFATPLRQGFTYLYRPKPFVAALGKAAAGSKRRKTAAPTKREGSADTEGVPLLPQLGQRVRTSLGHSQKEGWIVACSPELPESLRQAMEQGRVRPEQLKELEIADPLPLFGAAELRLARWLSHYYICSLGEALGCILPTGKKEKEPALYTPASSHKTAPPAGGPQGEAPKAEGGRDIFAVPAVLSAEQQAAIAAVVQALEQAGAAANGKRKPGAGPFCYLFGPTGSGKTEVFLQCMARTLESGKSVLYLVPEISLSYQLQEQLQRRFAQPVALMHSHLSAEMRLWYWRELQQKRCQIVLGARSAVFAPLANLGLIVLDEEHEPSYKAGETPRYHARQVAMRRCRDQGAVLLMGSATPSVEAMQATQYLPPDSPPGQETAAKESGKGTHEKTQKESSDQSVPAYLPEFVKQALLQPAGAAGPAGIAGLAGPTVPAGPAGLAGPAEQGGERRRSPPVQPLVLSRRLAGGGFPQVEIVDLSKSKTVLSPQLVEGIEEVTARGEQAILFLNRRGYAPIVQCFACGQVQQCKHCSISLSYHKQPLRLQCHHCGFSMSLSSTCMYCHRSELEFIGFGTEQIEEELQRHFSHLRTARLDTDISRQKGRSRQILEDFRCGSLDLLVGTQMVAKGLNFEGVKLVGVVLADTSLNMPDFRAAERGFSLLVQVAGRAGRFSLGGRVLIQTYQPQNAVITAAAAHDWQGFYRRELELRQLMHYPPFSRLIRLVFRGRKQESVRREAHRWQQDLAPAIAQAAPAGSKGSIELLGPCECSHLQVAGKFRYHILLRSKVADFARLHRCLTEYYWQAKRLRGVYVGLDVDPNDMM